MIQQEYSRSEKVVQRETGKIYSIITSYDPYDGYRVCLFGPDSPVELCKIHIPYDQVDDRTWSGESLMDVSEQWIRSLINPPIRPVEGVASKG